MAHRNRWISQRTKPPFMVGLFHGYATNNQMVFHSYWFIDSFPSILHIFDRYQKIHVSASSMRLKLHDIPIKSEEKKTLNPYSWWWNPYCLLHNPYCEIPMNPHENPIAQWSLRHSFHCATSQQHGLSMLSASCRPPAAPVAMAMPRWRRWWCKTDAAATSCEREEAELGDGTNGDLDRDTGCMSWEYLSNKNLGFCNGNIMGKSTFRTLQILSTPGSVVGAGPTRDYTFKNPV